MKLPSKVCARCKKDLPLAHFFKSVMGKDGRRTECKDCHRQSLNRPRSVHESFTAKRRLSAPMNEGRVVEVERIESAVGEPEKHLVFPDLHVPQHDPRAWGTVLNYMGDERWAGVHCLGDLIDNEAISTFNAGKPRRVMSALTVQEQFEQGGLVVDQWVKAARAGNPNVTLNYLSGNHEERTERYVDGHPELAGMVDVERGMDLKQKGVRYVRFWEHGEMVKIGKLYLGHGSYATSQHAAAHVRHYGCNMLYGHVHDIQAFSLRRRGPGTPIMAQSIGCLCRYDQAYMRGRPHNWEHGFAVVWVWPSGEFHHVVVRIINGRFIGPTNGRVYRA